MTSLAFIGFSSVSFGSLVVYFLVIFISHLLFLSTCERFKMSRVFTVIGDSNIRRHMSLSNCRDRPSMTGAQVLFCGHLDTLAEQLRGVRYESTVCLLSCITNFMTSLPSTESSSSVGLRVEPVLVDVREAVFSACEERPEMYFMLSPPMYRTTPQWYSEG